MKIAMLLVLFCSAASAQAESPLAEMAWMVGGQWEAKTTAAPNYFIETRTVVEFGPGKWSMRMLQYIKAKQGEYQQYETFFWVDPAKARVRYITFHTQGAAIRGTGEIKDGVLTLHQEAANPYPEMRMVFRPDTRNRDAYVGEIFYRKGGAWDKVKSATSVRKAVSSPPKLKVPERRGKLELLEKFAGGEFRSFAKGSDDPLARQRFRFSLHGRVLVGRSFTTKDGKERAESLMSVYADPASNEIRSVSIGADGKVTTGVIRPEGRGISWDTVARPRDGRSYASRSVFVWSDDDTYEMQFFSQVDGAWKLSPVALVGRREQPRK